jgi:molecular chaperone DnaJ
MAAYRDPWVILKVPRSADDQEIKKAYRALVRKYHPDRNDGDPEKGKLFQDVARAYAEIRDETARALWLSTHEGMGAHNEDLYDGFGSGLRRDVAEAQRSITVSFRESFEGANKDMTFPVDEPCGTCGGSGAAPGTQARMCPVCRGTGSHELGRVVSPCANCDAQGFIIEHPCPRCRHGIIRSESPFVVTIPAGIRDGEIIRLPLPSAGHLGRSEILIAVKVTPSAVFRRTLRDASDLLIIVPISYSEACFGTSIKVPTPDKTIQLRIPAGTQAGKAFRISGKGMPVVVREGVRNPGRGDLYARVQIVVPTKLSGPQTKLVQQLGNYDPADLRAGLFAALRE